MLSLYSKLHNKKDDYKVTKHKSWAQQMILKVDIISL